MGNDARQLAILAAIGIEVFRLRAPPGAPADPVAAPGTTSDAGANPASPRLVVAAAAGLRSDARCAARIAQIVRAVGAPQSATAWIDVAAGAAATALPDAPAYLMLGAAAARACSAQMPIARQQAASIAVIDDIGAVDSGAARRVLWQTLKPLARRLHAAGV